jgi:hypothetical protein
MCECYEELECAECGNVVCSRCVNRASNADYQLGNWTTYIDDDGDAATGDCWCYDCALDIANDLPDWGAVAEFYDLCPDDYSDVEEEAKEQTEAMERAKDKFG